MASRLTWVLIAAGVFTLGAGASATWWAANPHRGHVDFVVSDESSDSATLWISTQTCGGGPEVTVHETDTTVELAVAAWHGGWGDRLACSDAVRVELEDVLGNRVIVDAGG